jgi:predicted transcriptional regulator
LKKQVWFESLGTLSQVLSDQNRDLLKLILQTHPQSLSELAEKSSAVFVKDSMLLSLMERYGLIHFEQDPNRQLVPRFDCAGVEQEMSFRG